MRNITKITLLFAVAAMFATSCRKDYEFSHGIGLMNEANVLSADGGNTPIIVFSNTNWSARFLTPVNWASLDRLAGNKDGQVKFYYEVNYGRSRAVTVEFQGGGETAKIVMWQKPAIKDENVEMAFPADTVRIGAAAADADAVFTTNLVYQTNEMTSKVTYTPEIEGQGWIGNVSIEEGAGSAVSNLFNVKFHADANTTGEARVARLVIQHTDAGASWDAKGTTLSSNTLIIIQDEE